MIFMAILGETLLLKFAYKLLYYLSHPQLITQESAKRKRIRTSSVEKSMIFPLNVAPFNVK